MRNNQFHHPFVSRGGLKLAQALKIFPINPANLIVLDVGSSTGGFVDCLLQSGARKVYSVDTCYGELAWSLRHDSRVAVMERTNILRLAELPELVDLVTIDAGWTKLELILPRVKKFLKQDGKIIALLKPHYEAAISYLKKGVLEQEKIAEVVGNCLKTIRELGWKILDKIESPILGGGGNREFLILVSL